MVGKLELIVIFIIFFALFGFGKLPNIFSQLPKISKDLGKSLRSFKSGLSDDDSDEQSNEIEKKDSKKSKISVLKKSENKKR